MDELRKTFLAAILYGFIAGAVSVTIPIFLDEQGISLANIGYILGVATLIGGLISIYLGARSDVFGRRKLMSSLTGVWAGATFLLIPFKSIFAYVVSQSGAKFSSATLWNLFLSRITDLTKHSERGKYLGYFTAGFGLAYAFAHLAAGWILGDYGPDAIFLFITFVSLFTAGFILFTFREASKQKKHEKIQISFDILKTRNGATNAIVSFMNGAQRSIIYGFALYLFLAHTYGFAPEEIGLYTFIFLAVWGISSYYLGRLADKFGSLKTLLYGSAIDAGIWVVAAYFQAWEIFFLLMILENLVYPLYGVTTIKITSLIVHKENIGRDMNIFGYFDVTGAMFGVVIAGILATASFSYVFLFRAALTIGSALIAYFFLKLASDEREEPVAAEPP